MPTTRYRWGFEGRTFEAAYQYSADMHRQVRSMDHSNHDVSLYDRYIAADPFRDEVLQWLFKIAVQNRVLSDAGNEDEERNRMLRFAQAFVQSITYSLDHGEYPRYPSEMLMDGCGDCEDSAILLALFARACNYDCAFLLFRNSGFFGIGRWGHVDLGIAASRHGEFSGTWWPSGNQQYYFAHCNGQGRRIGEAPDPEYKRGTVHPVGVNIEPPAIEALDVPEEEEEFEEPDEHDHEGEAEEVSGRLSSVSNFRIEVMDDSEEDEPDVPSGVRNAGAEIVDDSEVEENEAYRPDFGGARVCLQDGRIRDVAIQAALDQLPARGSTVRWVAIGPDLVLPEFGITVIWQARLGNQVGFSLGPHRLTLVSAGTGPYSLRVDCDGRTVVDRRTRVNGEEHEFNVGRARVRVVWVPGMTDPVREQPYGQGAVQIVRIGGATAAATLMRNEDLDSL